MEVGQQLLDGVKLIAPQVFRDQRGFFLELFHEQRYKELLLPAFVQDNLSCSKYGTIRGMHFQTYPGQAKLITVVKGKIFDVFVDIRKDSKTYGEWGSFILDDQNYAQLFIPVGFAHGFCCLSEEAFVQYKVSHYYNAETEKGFRYDDPSVGIQWPIQDPILSERDLKAPVLSEVVFE